MQPHAIDVAVARFGESGTPFLSPQRLSEQLGVDLNDPETRLRLLLSYKVMDLL